MNQINISALSLNWIKSNYSANVINKHSKLPHTITLNIKKLRMNTLRRVSILLKGLISPTNKKTL